MNFAFTEEQRQLGDSVQRLLSEQNDFESRRERLLASPPDRMALWPQLAGLGAFDEEHGGLAGDPRTVAVVLLALGVSLVVEACLANAVVAGRILQASPAVLANRLIEDAIAGRSICVLAQNAGSDPFSARAMVVTRSGTDPLLHGKLTCVRHADVADGFLIAATEGGIPSTGTALGGGVMIYCLPRSTPGLSVQTYRLIDAAGADDVTLDSVRPPPEARLTLGIDAALVLQDALEWGVLGLTAEAAGIVCSLNRVTFAYLNNRRQFGGPLATFQVLQHRAADMFIAAEELCAAVDYAVDALTTPMSRARSAAICAAKAIADTGGRRVGHGAVQLHGAMGVSDELDMSHYAHRLAAIRAEMGSVDVHRLSFASLQ